MATTKYAAHIADIRGTVGNATFSRNRLGGYVRNHFIPADPRSFKQIRRRTYHHNAVGAWHNTLSDAQRIAWNDLGLQTTFINSAGVQYHPSGFNLYMRMYLFCSISGEAIDHDAPDAATAAAPPLTITLNALAQFKCTANEGWNIGKTGYIAFHISPILGPAIYSYSGPWKHYTTFTIAAFAAGIPNGVIGFDAEATKGDRLFLRSKAYYDSGDGHTVTEPYTYNALVPAP